MKKSLYLAVVGAFVVACLPVSARIRVYEPFDYPEGALNGQSGGSEIGFDGVWEAHSLTVVSTAANLTYGSLPTTGGGLRPALASLNRYGGSRTISAAALAGNGLLNDGAELWFSALMGLQDPINRTNSFLALALASGRFITANGTGTALEDPAGQGVGVDLWRGVPRAAGYTGSGNAILDSVTTPEYNVGEYGLIVGKIVWGATSDTIEIYRPDANLNLGNAVSSLTVNVNQATFNTLTFRWGERVVLDEIRFGSTYEDIVGVVDQIKADKPHPADGKTDVPRNVVLGWTPGEYAVAHDVYLGKTLADVSDANRTHPLNALASREQGDATYDPGRLAFDTTYFWRIDEVNAPPASTIFKGEVWSFTTEPVAYLITDVQASASSSSSAESEPANLVNGSGLTLAADGQWVHGTDEKTMWQSAPSGLPATVVFEFDGSYKLREMKLWNHNTSNEGLFGIGAKEVTIEVADSNEGPWTAVADTTLTRAPGLPDTPATDTIPMLGVMAGSVRLTIRSSQGGVAAAGLAEVQFFYIPVAPRELSPADGTALTAPEATLAWRSGREAAEHRVYLATTEERALVEGSDPAVLAATVPAAGPYASYAPTGLNLSQTYLWKITEVNVAEIPATHDSAILSFTTPQYLPVDDFESYKNEAFKEIWATWLDGTEFGTKDPTNGSIVGLDPAAGDYNAAPGRNGGQSLPMWFTNTATAPKSEVIRTSAFGDWTAHGIKSLSLWFYGDPANSGGRLYVKINNSAPIFCDGDPTDLAKAIWQPFNIDLSKVGGGVSSVTKLAIGVQDAGAKGVIRIDDIRLYAYDRQLITPTDPGTAGLQAQYLFEGNAADSSGNGRAGTLVGDPVFVAGKDGQAISLDGLDDYVNIDGYKGILADANGVQNPFTLCAWISATSDGEIITWGTNAAGQRMTFRVDTVLRVENAAGNVRGTNGPDLRDGEWHHVAATVPQGAEMMDVTLYVDGSNVTPPNTTTGLFNLQPDVDVRIGMGGPTGDRFLTGAVDDARIYDRVLSPGEIAFLAGKRLPFDKSF